MRICDELLAIIDEESDRLNRFIEGLSMAGTDAQALTPRTIGIDEVLRAGLSRIEPVHFDDGRKDCGVVDEGLGPRATGPV